MTTRLHQTVNVNQQAIPTDDLWGHRIVCNSTNLEEESIKAALLGGVIIYSPDEDEPFYITGLPVDCPIPFVLMHD